MYPCQFSLPSCFCIYPMFSILTFVRFVFILVSIMLDRMEGYRGGSRRSRWRVWRKRTEFSISRGITAKLRGAGKKGRRGRFKILGDAIHLDPLRVYEIYECPLFALLFGDLKDKRKTINLGDPDLVEEERGRGEETRRESLRAVVPFMSELCSQTVS